jgi:hypothetical protein
VRFDGLKYVFATRTDVLRRDRREAVVLEEHQPPVALRDRGVERAGGDRLWVGEGALEVAHQAGLTRSTLA